MYDQLVHTWKTASDRHKPRDMPGQTKGCYGLWECRLVAYGLASWPGAHEPPCRSHSYVTSALHMRKTPIDST